MWKRVSRLPGPPAHIENRVPHSTTSFVVEWGFFFPSPQISTTTNKRPAQASLERGTRTRHFTGSTFTPQNRKPGCPIQRPLLSLSGDFLPKSQISTTTNKRPAQASLERGTRLFTGSTFTKQNRKPGCPIQDLLLVLRGRYGWGSAAYPATRRGNKP